MRCVLSVIAVVALPLAPLSGQATAQARARIPSQFVARFPCPTPIPHAWGVADSTLATQPRCALVAAAVHAFRRSIAQSPLLRDIALSKVACIRVQRMTLRDPNTERVVADNWLVSFYSDGQSDFEVPIDPRTGKGRPFRSPREFGFSTRELCAPLPNDR